MRSNSQVDCFLSLFDASEPEAPLVDTFRSSDGTPDALRCAQVLGEGRERAAETRAVVDQLLGWNAQLTSAEAVAVLLAAAGVQKVCACAAEAIP